MNINKEKVFEIANKIICDGDVKLYEINFNYEFESDVIQILVESKENGSISFDKLSEINEKLSAALDEITSLDNPYILEVSSAGIERRINTKDELIKNCPSYIYCEYNNSKTNESFTGHFNKFENDMFFFSFFKKGQPKKISLKWEEILFIRHAINFSSIKD